MGMFDKNYEKSAQNTYEEIKKYLKPKNGNKYILLIHTGITNGNKPEALYTIKINEIVENMQNDGYEIIDIKLEIGGTQGLSYETLIVYK